MDSASSVKSVDRALEIIESLREMDGAGVSELANALDFPKSTIYSHLNTLHSNGYLIKEKSEYRLSLQFLEYGEYTRDRMKIYNIARPEIQALADETGELANMAVAERGDAVCLCVEKGQNAIRLDTHAGRRMPMYCTGMGKALLAFLPTDQQNRILDKSTLTERTEFTITDKSELRQEIDEIRDRGFSFDEQEYHRGLRCVGMPIKNEDDNALGAISVSGPISRMGDKRYRTEIPELLKKTVNLIEVNMSYTSSRL